MSQFKKILCYAEPVEQSAAALMRAVEVARAHGAKVSLISQVEEIPISIASIQDGFVKLRQSALKELVKSTDTTGVEVESIVQIAYNGTIDLIKVVIDRNYDLVVKAADSAGRTKSMVFGSNDQQLLRKCPSPVWIVKAHKTPRFERILMAVDVDPNEKENAELNNTIAELAISLAEQYGSELHIVHAWTFSGENKLRNSGYEKLAGYIDQALKEIKTNHQEWLDNFLQSGVLKEKAYTLHFEKGEPEDVISGIVNKYDIGLTVMGTVARTGIPGFFIGNTAEEILSAIDCSVLAVKPGSFSTPVQS